MSVNKRGIQKSNGGLDVFSSGFSKLMFFHFIFQLPKTFYRIKNIHSSLSYNIMFFVDCDRVINIMRSNNSGHQQCLQPQVTVCHTPSGTWEYRSIPTYDPLLWQTTYLPVNTKIFISKKNPRSYEKSTKTCQFGDPDPSFKMKLYYKKKTNA